MMRQAVALMFALAGCSSAAEGGANDTAPEAGKPQTSAAFLATRASSDSVAGVASPVPATLGVTTGLNATTMTTMTPASMSIEMPAPHGKCSSNVPFIEARINDAPECFERCPDLCAGVRKWVPLFMEFAVLRTRATGLRLKKRICADRQILSCALQADNYDSCKPFLMNGTNRVPSSIEDIDRKCSQPSEVPWLNSVYSLPAFACPGARASSALMLLLVLATSHHMWG